MSSKFSAMGMPTSRDFRRISRDVIMVESPLFVSLRLRWLHRHPIHSGKTPLHHGGRAGEIRRGSLASDVSLLVSAGPYARAGFLLDVGSDRGKGRLRAAFCFWSRFNTAKYLARAHTATGEGHSSC